MRLQFIPIHVFRETPSVTCFDVGVSGTNGTDVVVHGVQRRHHLMRMDLSSTTSTSIKWITIWCSRGSAPSSF